MYCPIVNNYVDFPEDSTFSAGLGVGVAIGFTAALVLAILGYVIVWLLRRKCRNQSGKIHTHLNQSIYCYAYTTNGFHAGQITATQPVYELPSTQERSTANNIRTQPNPGYGVHNLEEVQISTVDDYDYDYI